MAYYECNSGTKDFKLVLSITFASYRSISAGAVGTYNLYARATLDTTITYINEKITITNTTKDTQDGGGDYGGSERWLARIESIVIKSFKLL